MFLALKICDENLHEWKMIPSHLINIYCGKSFKFHSCLSYVRKLLIKFPKFYSKEQSVKGAAHCLLLPNYVLAFF